MKEINGKKFYTTAEVCKQFGFSRNTWNAVREKHQVRQFTVGRTIYFPASEIDRIMEESETSYHKGDYARRLRNKAAGVVDMDEVDEAIKRGIGKKEGER